MAWRTPRGGSGTRADEVGVVEAAYRLEGTETEWLAGIASASAPMLDEGLGVVAWTWTLTPGEFRLRSIAVLGGPPGVVKAVEDAAQRCDRQILIGLLRSAPCSSLDVSGTAEIAQTDAAGRGLLRLGIRDCVAVIGVDSGWHLVVLTAYRATPMRPSRRVVSRWSRVASHLAAGFRVRRGLAASGACARPDPFAGSEAILTPAGRLEHATGPAERARKALAQAVVAVNDARGPLRGDHPDAALDAWKGLVAGRWSLVDHVDTDGKRFLVARRNDPDSVGSSALSPREQQVLANRARGLSLKLIAYDLGLSLATISKSLKAGMTKLGLLCEGDLVGLSPAAGLDLRVAALSEDLDADAGVRSCRAQ